MKVAIIDGTDIRGVGLALRWAKNSDINLLIGSKDENAAIKVAAEIRKTTGASQDRVTAMSIIDAAKNANIVVLTVPFREQISTLEEVKDYLKKNTLLIDTTLPIEVDDDGEPVFVQVEAGSCAQQANQIVGDSVKVVSAFKPLGAECLSNLDEELTCDVIVCSDHEDARKIGVHLVEKLSSTLKITEGSLSFDHLSEKLVATLINWNKKWGPLCNVIRVPMEGVEGSMCSCLNPFLKLCPNRGIKCLSI
ncbi:NADPH-dependent F420 reductase [Candidatus Borrarchaeum sp.]|uniref:NADPH-dependent F420 reductase n=1 Tax=Candidatus Borrarchaeum sp. TaxID=2846742 RepID=UPI00257B6A92|nr:NADPH-dependent F420 reductase [Candidatus Borrarchaeum sp.]